MAQSVTDTASDVARRAGDMASNVGHRAEDTVSGVGERMRHLAGTIRQRAPHEGIFGTAAESVAGSLEASGRYLEEQNLSGIANDTTNLIRRYPLQAVLVGIGIGFLMARAMRS
jgi:hypothetical protein